jgi:hypothetical protein
MSWSSQWSLSFRFSHKKTIHVPLRSHAYYMPGPSNPPWLGHSIWRGVQVVKCTIMQYSLISCYFVSFGSSAPCSPIRSLHAIILLSIQNCRQNCSIVYFNLYGFRQQTLQQTFWTEWWQALPHFNLLRNFITNQILFSYCRSQRPRHSSSG